MNELIIRGVNKKVITKIDDYLRGSDYDWPDFLRLAAEAMPALLTAYEIYTDQYAHFASRGEVNSPMMKLGEFVKWLVNQQQP